jgi:TRAP-type C4-dicarboxylate transport system substrate-binding protein
MLPVGPLMNLSRLEAEEERKTGFYDYLLKEHEKIGLRYIGNAHVHGPFYLYAKEPIAGLEGLKGKRFRHSPAYPFFKALGIKPITSAHSEIYSGLERNMFDGLAINHTNFINLHLYEVCKYIVGPGFYSHGAASVIMNLGKFKGLPDQLQEVIVSSIEKAEPMIRKLDEDIERSNSEILESKGMKHIEWSANDNRLFLDRVVEVTWKVGGKKMKPEEVQKIKAMTGY